MSRRIFLFSLFGIALFVLLCDQTIKAIVEANVSVGEKIPFGPIDITLLYNTGIAFGASILPSKGVLVLSVLATIFFLFVFLWLPHNRYTLVSSGLIFGGALSNGYDRLSGTGVVDYLQAVAFWPVFNLADVAITVGLVIFLFYLFTKSKEDLAARENS